MKGWYKALEDLVWLTQQPAAPFRNGFAPVKKLIWIV